MASKRVCAGALCLAVVGARAFDASEGARRLSASAREEPERATVDAPKRLWREGGQPSGTNIPRPPVIKITPDAGSAAPDGYAPIPEWLGQTRAPRPAKTAEYTVETVAEGFTGAFCFSFLPDSRILVG